MEEGNIIGWLAKVGDKVAPGDVLAEVETDKATMELESFHEGVLLYIGIKEGLIAVDGILAVIGEEGEDYKQILAKAESELTKTAKNDKQESKATEEIKETTAIPAQVTSNDRIKASPLAKSIAKESGIDISQIQGSGDNGRIIKKDVETFIDKGSQSISNKSSSTTKNALRITEDFQYGDVPVSQMRKVIARRLGESKYSAPHFYLTIEIDMDNAVSSRKIINEQGDTRISFNDLIVKAAAIALRKNPRINSSWFGDKITYHEDINIGVAVAVADGLLVPVIRDADLKSLSMINSEVRVLAGKAKEKKLNPLEMSGNTFTISNLGMFGIDEFTAIINPPDACIMAIGSIFQKPVVKNNEIVIGNVMKVTLSCDHRVVDGVTGSKFLQTFREMLEQPLRMVV
jgi:pyruvate dehydrogenase E2 component (dihydrolipoamide acetyltransferase)